MLLIFQWINQGVLSNKKSSQNEIVNVVLNDLVNWLMFLQAPSQDELEKLSQDLSANQIDHKLWIEQPENYATCLATKPYPKQQIQSFFKKLKLFK